MVSSRNSGGPNNEDLPKFLYYCIFQQAMRFSKRSLKITLCLICSRSGSRVSFRLLASIVFDDVFYYKDFTYKTGSPITFKIISNYNKGISNLSMVIIQISGTFLI